MRRLRVRRRYGMKSDACPRRPRNVPRRRLIAHEASCGYFNGFGVIVPVMSAAPRPVSVLFAEDRRMPAKF